MKIIFHIKKGTVLVKKYPPTITSAAYIRFLDLKGVNHRDYGRNQFYDTKGRVEKFTHGNLTYICNPRLNRHKFCEHDYLNK